MAMINKVPVRVPSSVAEKLDLYWKPHQIWADLIGGRLECTLGLWESRDAAQLNAEGQLACTPLDSKSISATVAEYPQLQKIIGSMAAGADENAKKLLYELLAVHPALAEFGLESDEK